MTLKPLSLHQKRQLVGFLELICQELELTETQFHDAKQKYEAVGHWLDDGAIIKTYGPMIIPQGSISLGTTLRPIGRDEFDIDLVCKLINAGSEQNQAYIRNIVGARLRENKTYVEMLESLNRGWRLNYAKSSKFHLDIT
ncbi:nucleotidyltransferase, partial [bacterium]|nr:nucleotidyltransferase [bacterium]